MTVKAVQRPTSASVVRCRPGIGPRDYGYTMELCPPRILLGEARLVAPPRRR